MNLYCIIFGIMFISTSIIFLSKKGGSLVQKWVLTPNTNVDKALCESLSKNISLVFLFAGLIFLLSGFIKAIFDSAFIWLMIIWFIAVGIDVYFISKLNNK